MYEHHTYRTDKDLIDDLGRRTPEEVYSTLCDSSTFAGGMARLVPEHMKQSVVLWVALGRADDLGDFLGNFVRNDLRGAFRAADDVNRRNMWELVLFFHNYAPAACWGSEERVSEWAGILRDPD